MKTSKLLLAFAAIVILAIIVGKLQEGTPDDPHFKEKYNGTYVENAAKK